MRKPNLCNTFIADSILALACVTDFFIGAAVTKGGHVFSRG